MAYHTRTYVPAVALDVLDRVDGVDDHVSLPITSQDIISCGIPYHIILPTNVARSERLLIT